MIHHDVSICISLYVVLYLLRVTWVVSIDRVYPSFNRFDKRCDEQALSGTRANKLTNYRAIANHQIPTTIGGSLLHSPSAGAATHRP